MFTPKEFHHPIQNMRYYLLSHKICYNRLCLKYLVNYQTLFIIFCLILNCIITFEKILL